MCFLSTVSYFSFVFKLLKSGNQIYFVYKLVQKVIHDHNRRGRMSFTKSDTLGYFIFYH